MPGSSYLAIFETRSTHALLVAYWHAKRATALPVSTRECFHSIGVNRYQCLTWPHSHPPRSYCPPTTPPYPRRVIIITTIAHAVAWEMRRACDARAGGFREVSYNSTHKSCAFSAMQMQHLSGQSGLSSYASASGSAEPHTNVSGEDSDATEIAAGSSNDGSRVTRCVVGRGMRIVIWATGVPTVTAAGATNADATGGRCRGAEHGHRGCDLPAQRAPASWRSVCGWSV